MAIKKPGNTKKRTFAAANASGCGSSVTMLEAPPHPQGPGGASHVKPPPPLPPGVYFSPTREECLGFLNRRIAGDTNLADAQGYIFSANVYGESPEALRRRHPPASVRGRAEHAWWFLSETRFQSSAAGGGASKRADRRVQSGGYWRLEQSKEELKQSKKEREEEEEQPEEEADGVKNSFGFYVGTHRKTKTPWLMQEFTSANDDGSGKRGVPALYRVYVTPRANDKQLRAVFGEDGVKKGPDGKKKPARAMVPQEYFDGIAELLPEGSVRVPGAVVQFQQAPPPPPVPSEGLLEYHGHGQDVDQGQYLGQFQQQEGQYLLGPYQQQQAPFSRVAPPVPRPAPQDLSGGEFAVDDNLSMPMDQFFLIIDEHPAEMTDEHPAEMTDEQPAEMDGEQPAGETAEGGEPNWGSLGNIVGDDELADFNKEG